MTDYLAEIAARTVECPHLRGIQLTCFCKGSGRVLDPRFAGLRDVHTKSACMCMSPCPGYTINRDLEELLACAPVDRAVSLYNMPAGGWACNVFGLHAEADTPLEAAAKAVYEWLEAEKKVTA